MTAPAAPLEKAVAQGRAAMARWDKPEPVPVLRHSDAVDCVLALRSLLAALDADPWWSVWQKTYRSQREAENRLEEAEAALREIADTDCGTEQAALVAGREDTRTCAEKAPEYPDIWCGFCIARRYFARRDKLEVPE